MGLFSPIAPCFSSSNWPVKTNLETADRMTLLMSLVGAYAQQQICASVRNIVPRCKTAKHGIRSSGVLKKKIKFRRERLSLATLPCSWLCIFTQWSYSETFRDSLATYPLRHIPPLVPLFFSPFTSDISPKRPE